MPGKLHIQPTLVVLAIAIAAMAVFLSDVSAEPKDVTSLQIPKGATVQIDRQGVARLNNNNGETGTFDCRCSGANASGTCILGRGSSSIICGTSGSTCNGSCKLFTTTGGISGGVVMMKKK